MQTRFASLQTGIIAVILVILQPLGAMLRPDKESSRRPIFNIAHRTFGLLAAVLAGLHAFFLIISFYSPIALCISVITIFIAAWYFLSMWSNATAAAWIFVAFIIIALIIIAVQGVLLIRDAREQARITAIEMHNKPSGSDPNAPSDSYYYRSESQVFDTKQMHTCFQQSASSFGSISSPNNAHVHAIYRALDRNGNCSCLIVSRKLKTQILNAAFSVIFLFCLFNIFLNVC